MFTIMSANISINGNQFEVYLPFDYEDAVWSKFKDMTNKLLLYVKT